MTEEIVVNVEIPDTPVETPVESKEIVASDDNPELIAAISERLENIEARKRFFENLEEIRKALEVMKSDIVELRAEVKEYQRNVFDFMRLDAEIVPESETEILDEAPILPEVEIIPAEPSEAEKKEAEPTKRNRFFI